MYWLLNTVAGLYIVNEYNAYLKKEYPDLQTNIMVFATKWFTSILLTIAILGMLAFGSVMPCFGDFNACKELVVGLSFQIYFICVLTQQMFSSGYGTWFFLHLRSEEATRGESRFIDMDSDCLDLIKFFFCNEVIVGFLTLFQCFVLLCCGYLKSRHLREIEGNEMISNKRN